MLTIRSNFIFIRDLTAGPKADEFTIMVGGI
jgi:hypothetical protein